LTPTLWNRCLSQLESELSEQHLNTYIRPLQAYEEGPLLQLMAPNSFVLRRVQSNHLERICEIVASLSKDSPMKVDLMVGTGSLKPVMSSAHAMADAVDYDDTAAMDDMYGSPLSPSSKNNSPSPATFAAKNRGISEVHASALNPLFTFDTLVEGKSNQMGHAAAMQIGLNPGVAYNPFLIYGQSGLGKTHLMQAIGHAILQNNPSARVLYLNSEKYVVDMVAALQNGKMDAFKRYYRNLDALLIDDIQFLAKKEQSQEEFFHNFNALSNGS